jgi:hypothetical protein
MKEKEGEGLQDVFTPGDRQEGVQIEAFFFFSVLDPSGPSLLLLSGDPRTRKEARLRVSSLRGAWSPAARETVEKDGAVRFPSGERGREGSGKTRSERVDCGERERRVYPR